MKDKIGLIGVGNMGAAILEGLFDREITTPSHVWIYDKMQDKAKDFSKVWAVRRTSEAGKVVSNTRWILLAVKPQDLQALGDELKPVLTRQHGLISILAGTPAAKIRRAMGPKPLIIRAMPNLGAKVGQSMTAITGTSKSALRTAKMIFDACGQTVVLPERYFDLVTAVSGSGPAYFFFLMQVLADFGVRHGLRREDAELLAVQTARGAAQLAAGSDISPKEWRSRVTSKKGTTEAAFKVIERQGADKIFMKAFQAALDRGRQLSRL